MITSKEKHLKLADVLGEAIRNNDLLPGQKILSQSELCKKYNISRTSVHYAFNELEKRGVIVRKPGKGVYVKEKEDRKKFEDIAVLLPDTQRFNMRNYDNFGLEIFWGIEKRLREKGLVCKLRVVSDNELSNLPRIVSSMKPDGVILTRSFSDAEILGITKLNIPAVLAGRISVLPGISGTAPNIFDYYLQFCRKLIEEGNNKIVIMSRKDMFNISEFELLAQTLNQLEPEASVKIVNYFPEDYYSKKERNEFIYGRVQKMYDNNELPDVFIGSTDWVIFRIIEKLHELKIKVPDTVKLIGCLGILMPPSNLPQITTFKVNTMELGMRTVDALCKARKINEPVLEKLSLEYIEGDTYQKIKKGK